MVLVTQDVRQRIDWLLRYLTSEWMAVEEAVGEWDAWSDHDRLDFRLEWPIKESYLHILRQHAVRQELSAEQCTAYESLQRLIDRQRPSVQSLLREDDT